MFCARVVCLDLRHHTVCNAMMGIDVTASMELFALVVGLPPVCATISLHIMHSRDTCPNHKCPNMIQAPGYVTQGLSCVARRHLVQLLRGILNCAALCQDNSAPGLRNPGVEFSSGAPTSFSPRRVMVLLGGCSRLSLGGAKRSVSTPARQPSSGVSVCRGCPGLPDKVVGAASQPTARPPQGNASARPEARGVSMSRCREVVADADPGDVTETNAQHRQRHPTTQRQCPRCVYLARRRQWEQHYASYRHEVHGVRANTIWLAPRSARLGGGWALGCLFCANLAERLAARKSAARIAGDAPLKRKRGCQDANTKWARFEVSASSQIAMRGLVQHANTLMHRKAARVYFCPDQHGSYTTPNLVLASTVESTIAVLIKTCSCDPSVGASLIMLLVGVVLSPGARAR